LPPPAARSRPPGPSRVRRSWSSPLARGRQQPPANRTFCGVVPTAEAPQDVGPPLAAERRDVPTLGGLQDAVGAPFPFQPPRSAGRSGPGQLTERPGVSVRCGPAVVLKRPRFNASRILAAWSPPPGAPPTQGAWWSACLPRRTRLGPPPDEGRPKLNILNLGLMLADFIRRSSGFRPGSTCL